MNNKLSWKEKLAFGMGDVGCNFVWTTVSSFLTLYYTDSVGISAAAAGTIMLLSRLLDGLTDLGFGTILDRTNTKWGKARPWILWSTPMMMIGLVLLFHVPAGFSMSGKVAYAGITYVFLAAFAYTASNLSYNALLSLMTNDQQERTTASTIRFFCTILVAIVIASATMPLVGKVGWTATSIIYAVLAGICFMITFLGTKERNAEMQENKKEEVSVSKGFLLLFKNRYFYSISLLFVVNYLWQGISSGLGIYFARDVMGNENVFGLFSLCTMVPMVVGLPVFPLLAGKFGKWKCMMAGCIISILGSIVLFINPTNIVVVLTGLAIKGIGTVPNTAGLFALVADGVVYGEWKNGVRQDGLFNSVTSFGMKVGTGLGTAMVGWGLAFGKYDGTLSVQTAETVNVIKLLYIGAPLISMILALICLGFSNLDKIYPTMMHDLEERKKNMEQKSI